eukprot:PITA_23938
MVSWSYEDMPGIDPSIVVHEIPTYLGAKPVRQRLRPVHPRKAATIKTKVEKLLKGSFIHPIPLTDWVSNIVPVNKKQAHSAKCQDHPAHLHEIFLHCRHYRIRLNPHKCVFCVDSGRLLRFIISREGIHLDPLKVEAILNLPPPASLQQLQSLQGKENFLRCFILNYAEVAKCFTRLLKRDTPFHWDATAQESFKHLKALLVSAPL